MGGMIVQEMATIGGDNISNTSLFISTGPRGEMPGRF